MHRRPLFLSALALIGAFSPALAQETVRLRGTVEGVDGNTYTVKTRDGQTVKVVLGDKPTFTAIVKASMADIKPGTFIGATSLPEPDGSLRAVEVHIFPEAMRGTGEGHRPWDLAPQATMTNANVETAVSAVQGQTLTVKYKDGEKTIKVTPETAVVSFAPGNQADVKAGTKIFIVAAQKQPDGSLQTQRMNYGKDGLAPPM
jgi:outer membrane lipoprotein SlyB